MRKIRCLIVDDEPPIVQRLAAFFEKWKSQGAPYVLVGKTCSSREAVQLALELKPDVILTDIVMPELNGIELIGELKDKLPATEFIILSAYSDFTYAKQAIAYNVLDYLVKIPMKENEVYSALEKARGRLSQKEEKEQQYNSMKFIVKENIHRIRKQLIAELLRGDLSARAMELRAGEMLTAFQPFGYCCFAVRIDDYERFCTEYGKNDQNSLRYAMLNIIEEIVNGAGHGFAYEPEPNLFLAFVSFKERSTANQEGRMYGTALDIQTNIKQYLKQSVSVGSSHIYSGWDMVGAAYRQAVRALWDSFYMGQCSIITQSRRFTYDEDDADHLLRSLRGISDSLTPLNAEASIEEMKELLTQVRVLKVAPVTLIEAVKQWMLELDRKLFGSSGRATSNAELSFDFVTQWEQLMLLMNKGLKLVSGKLQTSDIHPEIMKAIQFIESRLAEPLSLSLVAEHIRMNSNYVSELFKKELQENFTDYVNRLRIEKAIALLSSNKDYSNLELAQAVGIQTEKYFCTLFKKYTGTSPQKFTKPRILK